MLPPLPDGTNPSTYFSSTISLKVLLFLRCLPCSCSCSCTSSCNAFRARSDEVALILLFFQELKLYIKTRKETHTWKQFSLVINEVFPYIVKLWCLTLRVHICLPNGYIYSGSIKGGMRGIPQLEALSPHLPPSKKISHFWLIFGFLPPQCPMKKFVKPPLHIKQAKLWLP